MYYDDPRYEYTPSNNFPPAARMFYYQGVSDYDAVLRQRLGALRNQYDQEDQRWRQAYTEQPGPQDRGFRDQRHRSDPRVRRGIGEGEGQPGRPRRHRHF
jgi:hypothetical protein